MLKQSSFAGFNFDDGPEWRIYDGHTVPLLKTFLTPYAVAVTGGSSVSKVYDGEAATFSGSTGTLPPPSTARWASTARSTPAPMRWAACGRPATTSATPAAAPPDHRAAPGFGGRQRHQDL
jgi:hypothetical protein